MILKRLSEMTRVCEESMIHRTKQEQHLVKFLLPLNNITNVNLCLFNN